MKNIIVVIFASFYLTACGTTSKLESYSASDDFNLSGYKVVSVQNFDNKDSNSLSADIVDIVARDYADKIADNISSKEIFDTVTRKEVSGKALVITGDIIDYDDGDAALRMLVGFMAGNANFDAYVYLIDNETKSKIGQISVDKNSWALGGILAASQNAKVLMDASAKNVASRIEKAVLESANDKAVSFN